MKKLALLLAVLVGSLGCSPMVYTHGVPNFAKVESGLWRSGQPESLEAWQWLYAQGVREVVKLNAESEGADDDAAAAGLIVHALPLEPVGDTDVWDAIRNSVTPPDPDRLARIAYVIEHATGGVLVHCTHGQDRTGLVVGRWRHAHDGWTKARAWDEMLAHHFHPELLGLVQAWLATP